MTKRNQSSNKLRHDYGELMPGTASAKAGPIPIRMQILMDSDNPDKGHLGEKDHVLGKEVLPLPATVQEGKFAILLGN